jgi:hypothetical protein
MHQKNDATVDIEMKDISQPHSLRRNIKKAENP